MTLTLAENSNNNITNYLSNLAFKQKLKFLSFVDCYPS